MAVQARRRLLWTATRSTTYGCSYGKAEKPLLSPPSYYCTSAHQNQGWRSLFKICFGQENVWKQCVQGRYQCQNHLACPAIPFRHLSACSTHKSMSLLYGDDAGLCVPRVSSAVCLKGLQSVRHRSGGKKSKSSSSSSDEDSDLEELDDDDYEAPLNFKKMKVYLKSLRADSVISSALDISRNRVDEIFFGSRLRLNGEKLLKKSKQMEEGDYVDLIVERASDDDRLLVKRVKVINISSERTNKDKIVVTVKVWKSPFPIEDALKAEWKQD